jgi:Ca2+-binding EF-hand superfamily protein
MDEDEIRATFELFDKDGDGRITADEVRDVLDKLGEVWGGADAEEVLRQADTDQDGRISFDEFVRAMGR